MIIAPGHDSAGIIIHPLADEITEGPETVILKILKKTCYGTILLPDTITILDNSPLSVALGDDITLCPGDSAQLTVHVTGGLAPFIYTWNHTPVHDSSIVVKPNPSATIYIAAVTGRCGITVTDTLVIRVEPVALLINQPAAKAICSGDTSGIILLSNISKALFSWEPTLISGSASGFSAGTGTLINQVIQLNSSSPGVVNFHIRVSGNGCDTTFTDFVLTINPQPEIELGAPVFLDPGSGIELHAGGGFSGYLWSTESSDSVIRVTHGGAYWVVVKNEYGCMDSDTIMVHEFGLFMPNAFTPNGDGLNDRFRIEGFEQNGDVVLQVFNRWGNLIFETNNLDKGWDGTQRDGSRQAGAFGWIIHFGSGENRVFKGTVTVIL